MDIAGEIRTNLGDDWLPDIYQEKVRIQRTRSLSVSTSPNAKTPPRSNTPCSESS